MALPEEFNEWEFLQDTIRKVENRKILSFFSDLGGEDWDTDLSSNRGSLRHACTHKDQDTATMTLLRSWLFYFAAFSQAPFQYEQQPIYGLPQTTFDGTFTYIPQVKLIFREDPQDVEPGFDPIVGEIGFRLMGETSESLSMAEVQSLANRIETEFGTGNGFVWRRGWHKCTYLDKVRGYDLRLLTIDEAEGRELVGKVLDIQGHTPNWENFSNHENAAPSTAYPTLPPTMNILGKVRRMPRRRPRADVRFLYAHLFVWGLAKPLIIVNLGPGGVTDLNAA